MLYFLENMNRQKIMAGLEELFFNQDHGKTLDEYKAEHVSKTGKQQFQQLQKMGLGISIGLA